MRKIEDALDTTFFTADWHLGHRNILRFCNRPFKSIEEHDAVLIANADVVVGDGTCYHLGDFSFRSSRPVHQYLEQLTGRWYFIPGGHDHWLRRYSNAVANNAWKYPPLITLDFDIGEKHPLAIVLCHYAMRRWDRSHYGSLHLFGHSHGNLERYGRSMDVGVDAWDYKPISLRQVIAELSEEEPTEHH